MHTKTGLVEPVAAARRRVTRREERRYACGCSTTRIESFSLPAQEPAASAAQLCAAHGGEVLRVAVVSEYGPSRE
ncbi:MAG: hypothetical protein KIS85_06490 [Anaerolineales bacterium]|nr:hypothetical protein [Anaerolineales bacterium]